MAVISNAVDRDTLELYQGFDQQQVGLGLINPDIYATPDYSKRKIQKLGIGILTEAVYSGFDHDPNPLMLPLTHEPAYNTILAYNLNYVPRNIRQAILKFVIDSNANRIRANQPILIDYQSLKRAIPASQYIIRRYKQVGIRPIESFSLVEWPEVIKRRSKWEGHYRKLKKTR